MFRTRKEDNSVLGSRDAEGVVEGLSDARSGSLFVDQSAVEDAVDGDSEQGPKRGRVFCCACQLVDARVGVVIDSYE